MNNPSEIESQLAYMDTQSQKLDIDADSKNEESIDKPKDKYNLSQLLNKTKGSFKDVINKYTQTDREKNKTCELNIFPNRCSG